MHHRAIYLLNSRALVSLPTTSFTSVLQAAASRAWSRTVSTDAATTSGVVVERSNKIPVKQKKDKSKSSGSSKTSLVSCYTIKEHLNSQRINPSQLAEQSANPVSSNYHLPVGVSRCKQKKPFNQMNLHVGLTYIDPDYLSETDMTPTENSCAISDVAGTSNSTWNGCDLHHLDDTVLSSRPVTHVEPTPSERHLSRLLIPRGSNAFHQNLLRLISMSKHPPSLPVILDYHALYPDFHTTRSYNLLLALTLRHTAFGTFQSLLDAMRSSPIERNAETWKLEVRWLVQTGSWDQAWRQATDQRNRPVMASGHSVLKLPLLIWVEFFRTVKRGAQQRRIKSQGEGVDVLHTHEINLDRNRQELLFRYLPRSMENLSEVAPNVIQTLISCLLKAQRQDEALSLTISYLRALPRRLDVHRRRACINIINLHVAIGSSSKGLRKLWESRRTLFSLLRQHRNLRPNSTTLFLLLSPLRQAKRCGTIAMKISQAFKAEWGDHTEDSKVRRRIATLALKEGRVDIAKELFESESVKSWARWSWSLKEDVLGDGPRSPYRKLLRSSGRILFAKNGRERRLWQLARCRANRVGLKRAILNIESKRAALLSSDRKPSSSDW